MSVSLGSAAIAYGTGANALAGGAGVAAGGTAIFAGLPPTAPLVATMVASYFAHQYVLQPACNELSKRSNDCFEKRSALDPICLSLYVSSIGACIGSAAAAEAANAVAKATCYGISYSPLGTPGCLACCGALKYTHVL